MKKKSSPRILIAIPVAGPMVYWRSLSSVMELERPDETDLLFFQGALIDRARNLMVEKMWGHPLQPTHLFFVDSDMVLPSDALMKLLKDDCDIVSGLYRKRVPPHEPLAYRMDKNKTFQPIAAKEKGLIEVDVVGAGCLLIKRQVFEKIPGIWFQSQWREEGHISEDFFFCEQARKAGVPVFVNTAVKAVHIEALGITTSEQGEFGIVAL